MTVRIATSVPLPLLPDVLGGDRLAITVDGTPCRVRRSLSRAPDEGSRPRAPALARRRDDGQLLPLIIGYAVVLALLITVVVDVSSVYLERRALAAAADAAALAAINAVDPAAVVDGRVGASGALVVSAETAVARVGDYVADAHLETRFEDFAVQAVELGGGGTTVTVTVAARVPIPFVNAISDDWRDGLMITAAASARAPLVP